MIKVYVDSRERDKIILLKNYFNKNKLKFLDIDSISVKTLPVSDLCTSDGLVGIERKSKADFISSLIQGKLKQQLYELKQNFKNPFLFVEGYNGLMDCILQNPKIHPNVILGATASVMAHSKVPITYVGDFYVPVSLMVIEKFYDGKEMTDKDYNPIRPTASVKDYKKYIVKGLPGIGDVSAETLLCHFGYSIRNIVNSSVEELVKIPGIGEKTAKKILEVLS